MTTENQIAVLAPSERAAVGLNSTKTEAELRALVAASADIVEVKDKAGRQQVHAAAMALRTRWADIDKIGKELRDDANKFSAAVIEEAKRLTDIIKPEGVRLIALRVPDSGTKWLDDMIRASLRDQMAAGALNAILRQEEYGIQANSPGSHVAANCEARAKDVWASDAYEISDAMLVARGNAL